MYNYVDVVNTYTEAVSNAVGGISPLKAPGTFTGQGTQAGP